MLKITDKGQYREIAATSGYLHRLGTEVYAKAAIMMPTDTEDNFEEVASIPTYTEAEYEAEVVRLIRERYSVADELAILRQRDSKPEEFAAYNAFAEECKAQAKAQLAAEAAGYDGSNGNNENNAVS